MKVAKPVMTSVPMIACTAPPPSPTTFRSDSVKNAKSKRPEPFWMAVASSETSGTIAMANVDVTASVATRSVARRDPSTARDQR